MKPIFAALAVLAGLALAAPGVSAMGGDPTPAPMTKDDVKQDFADGKKAIQASQYDKAIQLMKKVAAAEPNNADAYNYLGFAYRKKGEVKPAAAAYETALKLDPQHKGALEYQGELFLKLGRLDQAAKNRTRLVGLCPSGCPELKELDRAIADYKAAAGGGST